MLRKMIFSAVLMLVATASFAQTTEVSVTFDAGLIGRFGNNTGQADEVVNTGNVGITSATFSQQSDNGKFGGTQGNDYCGTLTLNGPNISFPACVNWRITSPGSVTDYIGFTPEGSANVSPDADPIVLPYSGTYNGFDGGYVLVVDSSINNESPENNFAFRTTGSSPAYPDGANMSGNAAASSALQSLNTYLAAQPDTTAPTITGPSATTTNGTGTDSTEVADGATAVTTFMASEEVVWSLEGTSANLFTIDATGALSFVSPAVFDPNVPANNVYVVDVVATDLSSNRGVMTFTVTVLPPPPVQAVLIQGPSGQAGDLMSQKSVQSGTADVYQFTATNGQGSTVAGSWSIRDLDAALFTINSETGALSFVTAPTYIPGGLNSYQVWVVFTYAGTQEVTQRVTINVLPPPVTAMIQGPSGQGGDSTSQKTVQAGTTDVYQFSAADGLGATVTGAWSIRDYDASLLAIDATTGALSFLSPTTYTPGGDNSYQVKVVFAYGDGQEAVQTVTIDVLPPPVQAMIQGPSGQAGAETSQKTVPAGTTDVHQFAAVDGQGASLDGTWSLRDLDAALFTINPTTGALSFLSAPSYIPGDDNTYQVWVVFSYDDGKEALQLVTIEVLDTATEMLARDRGDIEKIIVDTEIAKLRGQQTFLRSITSAARDRLAAGGCGEVQKQDPAAEPDQQDCRLNDHTLQIAATGDRVALNGHERTVLSLNGYRRITNLDLAVLDQGDLRTLSFNGYFGLETTRFQTALYGMFTGVSFNRSDVQRSLSGSADAYGISLGAYAVHELGRDLYSELYLSIGRSQNQLDLTDGTLDVAADYGTTEAHFGWVLSGKVEKDNWDILPEAAIQLSRSDSSSVEVTGELPDESVTANWEGLTATLARADISTEFRYYLGGRADDAWVLSARPGVACEQIDAITLTSGCGLSSSIGLDRVSADGKERFSAKLSAEEIAGIDRQSAALSYELNF